MDELALDRQLEERGLTLTRARRLKRDQAGTGKRLGGIEGSGGVYCVLTEDEQFISMPSSQKEKQDTVRIADLAECL